MKWEIEIKRALGRLDAGDADLAAEIEANRFAELPVRATHAVAAARLPTHHGDPFDRILVAQSQVDGLICVTRDAAFDPYGVATLW